MGNRGLLRFVVQTASVFVWLFVMTPQGFATQATQAPKVVVTTTSDDRISGRLIQVTADRIELETSYGGRIRIRTAELKEWASDAPEACARLGSTFPSKMKAGNCVKALPSPPVAAKPRPQTESQRTIDFAYSAARGNTNNTDMNAALNLSHNEGSRRIAFSVFGRRSVSNSAPVTNLLISTLRLEKAILEQPGFGEVTVEIDRLKLIGFRITNSAGLTYPVLKAKSAQMSFDFGTGLTREIFRTGFGRTSASGLLRVSAAQKIDERAQLTQQITLMSDLLTPEAYRVQADVALTMPITKHLAFRLVGLNRFESQPQGNARRNDFSLLTGLKFKF